MSRVHPDLTVRAAALYARAVSAGIVVESKGATRWLRLARPPRNLLEPEAMDALAAELRGADEDGDVAAIVLTGSDDVFCGGLDIAQIRAGADPVEFARSLVALLRLLPTLGTPVLAAVNGDALASGFSLACAVDYAVTVPDAKLGTFEASVGTWPMIAQVPVLQRLLPRHALQNVLSGVPFDAEEALRVGAVNRVVPAGELERAVLDYAELATRAGAALPAGRRAFYRFLDLGYDEALVQALDEFTAMFRA